ncbi:MAG: small subunit ribosomal protein S1 [Alphaproteobacteria bacterium]|jgi:small subunit ribosomal protein S1
MSDTNAVEGPSMDDFEALLNESFGINDNIEGSVVRGRIVAIERDFAIIDFGIKTEGRVELKEFTVNGKKADLKVGDMVDIYVERLENSKGEAVLSRDKARREEAWAMLEKSYDANEQIEGLITARVKGGFTVDMQGAVAFLPGSQVDVRPLRDISHLMNAPHKFAILKMDHRRGNIVVSRRAVIEEERAEQRAEIIDNLAEGQVVEGIVKNVTDYGAFIDLGGIDGLLHVTDISWKRINHPSEVLSVGETIKVVITKISDTKRLSLGMKQLEADPWEGLENKFPLGDKIKGKITNIADYGAFVELADCVEGLIHVTELSWTKKNLHPNRLVTLGQEVDVQILEIDYAKRRISLGMKQCMDNPWNSFAAQYPVGSEVTGEIRNVTEFGLFIGVSNEIDGMVHLNDISWSESGDVAVKDYKKGDLVTSKVLEVDIEKERISLGIKQLGETPANASASGGNFRKGMTVTCTVTAVQENGLEVTVGDDNAVSAFIRKGELSRDRSEQRPARFAVGDKIDALVATGGKNLTLSIRALEIAEEKEAVAQYGSTDSGASLGDILGAALKKRDSEA